MQLSNNRVEISSTVIRRRVLFIEVSMLYRLALKKLKSSETDHRLGINIPLIVAEKAALSLRPRKFHRAQENVKRRVATPLELILIGLNQPDKTLGIESADTFDPGAV